MNAMPYVSAEWDGPGTGFIINRAVAYVDTVEVLVVFPRPSGLLKRLRKLAGKRMHLRNATSRVLKKLLAGAR